MAGLQRHLSSRLDLMRQHQGISAEPDRGGSRLAAGMAAADDDESYKSGCSCSRLYASRPFLSSRSTQAKIRFPYAPILTIARCFDRLPAA